MIRRKSLILCLLVAFQPFACKRKVQEMAGTGHDKSGLQGKPDKVSEEPTGLPGYPLACAWLRPPANDTLNAAVDCSLSDAHGKPVTLDPAPVWSVRYQGAAAIETSTLGNQSLRINASAKTREVLDLALLNMQVVVSWKGQEKAQAGRDLLKARAGGWRFAATCQSLFTLLMVDASSAFSYAETNRFDGCEVLSNRLMNVVVPDAALRGLADSHKTIGASCSNGVLTLAINQPSYQSSASLGAMDPQACLDMSALINSLSL